MNTQQLIAELKRLAAQNDQHSEAGFKSLMLIN